MKFTKDDLFVHEVYSPPQGEKDVFLFPIAFGGTNYWSYFKELKLKAERRNVYNGQEWTVSFNYTEKLFTTKDRFTIFDVVNFLNKPSAQRTKLFEHLIMEVFK